MTALALVTAALAALLHVYIFVLESIAWTGPRARKVFGMASVEEAEQTRELAYNQGFYNLFLAIVTAVGIVLLLSGQDDAGAALILAGTGSMLAAAIVLVTRSRAYARAAASQGTFPLIAVASMTAALLA
ncbi:DUF1304 domain-containing protein [Demequina salsinemoris]|uniref:DUF1304 domain-containing protein n=1 Tax=Demequina salsinemoris TaxID=577470 RepID=UPI00078335E2|nr:DUF1304 domain-containing protein [Demequina salsinemoris]